VLPPQATRSSDKSKYMNKQGFLPRTRPRGQTAERGKEGVRLWPRTTKFKSGRSSKHKSGSLRERHCENSPLTLHKQRLNSVGPVLCQRHRGWPRRRS
jgi:hypothetical protein